MSWFFLCCALAHAGIALDPVDTTAIDVETVVVVSHEDGRPRAGETVRVIHRPGLDGQRELAIGITDGRGRVRWTPAMAGLAEIRAGDETRPIRIAWDQPPTSTLTLLLLLTVAGLGAVGYGLAPGRSRLRAPRNIA